MFDFLAQALAWFYDLWPSYGMAIVLLTLAIMLVLTPLSIKSTRSMIAMQRVGPELKKLQAKYKDDRETLNREMMAFYKENNINPASSCLPLLLQMPVFFVLYQVLSGLTRRSNGENSTFDPKYLDRASDLYQDLVGSTEMFSFGMDLSRSALYEIQNVSLLASIPYVLLVGLVVVTSIVQQRQIAGRNSLSGTASANPQQQMIARILPFVFIPVSISIPSGVVIYFVVSNLVRIGQQAVVTRLEFSKDGTPKTPPAGPPKDKTGAIDVDGGDPPPAAGPGKAAGPGGRSRPPGGSGNGTGNGTGRPKTPPGRAGAAGNGRTTGNGAVTPKRAGAGATSAKNRSRKRKRK